MSWAPPPRPEWVSELNAFGCALGSPETLVPLDEESLLRAACAAAGGLDDFGDDDWRESFEVFRSALEAEADLTLVGRLMARNEIVRSLRNRLQVLEQQRLHPDMSDERITAPVLVTGTGRSGTSLLHELLAQDSRHRVLRTWEALHPASRERGIDDLARIAHQEHATFWNLVTPEYATMHENAGDSPQEDGLLVMPTFLTDHLMGQYNVPTYAAHLATADMAPVLAFHQRCLQLLQRRERAERWVLKWPGFLAHLPDYFAAYPDVTVVLTHRDPLRVVRSMVSLMATLRWQRSESVDVEEIVSSAVNGTAYVFDRVTRMRADGRLPGDKIVDVRYVDLVTDPVGTMKGLYERLGSTLSGVAEQQMRAHIDAKPKGSSGAHRYSFSDTGLDEARTREMYAAYMDRYDVPEEP